MPTAADDRVYINPKYVSERFNTSGSLQGYYTYDITELTSNGFFIAPNDKSNFYLFFENLNKIGDSSITNEQDYLRDIRNKLHFGGTGYQFTSFELYSTIITTKNSSTVQGFVMQLYNPATSGCYISIYYEK